MTSLTLRELSLHLAEAGLPNEIHGSADVLITGCNTIESAGAGEITFLANPRYRDRVKSCQASAIIMRPDDLTLCPQIPQIICDDPYRGLTMAVVRIHGYRRHPQWGISPQAAIDASARVGADPSIGPAVTICAGASVGRGVVLYPGAYVGPGVELGDDVVLHPNVAIYDGCKVGSRVTIHAGSVIGADGLGYAPVGRTWLKIPQAGIVVIEDNVEIGANCTIDRATLGRTRIGAGSKVSNLVAIGHGCDIGPDCMIVAQVGMAGSVKVGQHVTIAGQAGIVGHLHIGDDATVCAQAGVRGSVKSGQTVLGAPAVEVGEARRQLVALQRLPEMRQRIRTLERELAELRQRMDGVQPSPASG